jgi:hypothetical protein
MMFAVTEDQAARIRTALEQRGEFSAAVELRRMFPAIADTQQARECVRMIAGWKALPAPKRRPPRHGKRMTLSQLAGRLDC